MKDTAVKISVVAFAVVVGTMASQGGRKTKLKMSIGEMPDRH
jgi:hypothetical protein